MWIENEFTKFSLCSERMLRKSEVPQRFTISNRSLNTTRHSNEKVLIAKHRKGTTVTSTEYSKGEVNWKDYKNQLQDGNVMLSAAETGQHANYKLKVPKLNKYKKKERSMSERGQRMRQRNLNAD